MKLKNALLYGTLALTGLTASAERINPMNQIEQDYWSMVNSGKNVSVKTHNYRKNEQAYVGSLVIRVDKFFSESPLSKQVAEHYKKSDLIEEWTEFGKAYKAWFDFRAEKKKIELTNQGRYDVIDSYNTRANVTLDRLTDELALEAGELAVAAYIATGIDLTPDSQLGGRRY